MRGPSQENDAEFRSNGEALEGPRGTSEGKDKVGNKMCGTPLVLVRSWIEIIQKRADH
jgi:hypothetical protein